MMQSISHWGQFEMQAPGTDHFRETLKELAKECEPRRVHLHVWQNTNFGPDMPTYDANYLHTSSRANG